MPSESHSLRRSSKLSHSKRILSTSDSSEPVTPASAMTRSRTMKERPTIYRSASEADRRIHKDKKKSKSDSKINKNDEKSDEKLRKDSEVTEVKIREQPSKLNENDEVLHLLKKSLSYEENWKKQAEREFDELKRQFEESRNIFEQHRQRPESKFDKDIEKHECFNQNVKEKISEAKDKLKNLSQSLKDLRTCGKDCNIHMRDLIIDYNCISKNELAKEMKRFQRMEIDLKNNLDRLHWRMDCEAKMYHNLIDQFQKLQMDLYYLKNVNENSHSSKNLRGS